MKCKRERQARQAQQLTQENNFIEHRPLEGQVVLLNESVRPDTAIVAVPIDGSTDDGFGQNVLLRASLLERGVDPQK